MATKKRSTSAPRPETLAPRHLWLAGLGLLSLTRKRAQAAAADAASGANTLKALVAQLADDAESSVRGGAARPGATVERRGRGAAAAGVGQARPAAPQAARHAAQASGGDQAGVQPTYV
ncbi:hypothetical protein [Xanthomonas graminis]|uniref:hypothetical protein n=1 Tax=Xanthomonas graminis TaxID=3390026 RepID=UPI000AD9BD7D|nr:hypothetical protein [Xanthomonas translucens]